VAAKIMSIQFNAESIFEIGVQIEKNGKNFYLEAAKNASDEPVRSLFTELADWENKHIELFEQLKSELPSTMREDNLFDPDNEYYMYLEAAANSHIFVASIDVSQLVGQCNSPSEILDLALTFEKDSVVYYTTVKKMVANYLGREKIDTLIDEELKHIAILNKRKKQMQ
jgi:rubrerythrin